MNRAPAWFTEKLADTAARIASHDGALTQITVKARSANAKEAQVRAAYNRVRPLLTDPKLTTADVAGQLAGAT